MYCKLFKSIGCSHTVYKYWMQHCIVACIQSVSSAINLHLTAPIDAGIYAVKLNASVGCRIIVASNGCSINFCIQSVSSSRNYCNKLIIMHAYMQQTECKYWMQTNFCQYWMQHNSLYPK